MIPDLSVLIFGLLLLGFIVWQFAKALHHGSLYSGVFFGNFQEIRRNRSPLKFYFALILRVLIATGAILLALGLLRSLLHDLFT